ncbi:hypothetical protein ACWDBD_37315 [Streptomyces sp. NPDC001118]
MTTSPHDPDDRLSYSRAALARIVLSDALTDLADSASGGVPTRDAWVNRGEIVAHAVELMDRAREVLSRAVIYERARGASWEQIGYALDDISRQSAHERYKNDVAAWEHALLEPQELPEAAYQPTAAGRRLDAWMRARYPDRYGPDDHPVTGDLPTQSAVEEMVQVLDAIRHLQETDAAPADRAAVYERKARLLDRIAVEDGKPEAAEQAIDVRARAARLREQAAE